MLSIKIQKVKKVECSSVGKEKCSCLFPALFVDLYLTTAVYLSSIFAILYGNVRAKPDRVSCA